MKRIYTIEDWKRLHCSRYISEQEEIEKRKLRRYVKTLREKPGEIR